MGTNEKIKIEKGVPMPSREKHGYRAVLKQMEVGDSFEAPLDDDPYIRQSAGRLGMRIAVRTERGVSRFWRVQ